MKYIKELYQFDVMIENKQLTLFTEWYDSTIAYKGFYALENKNGFSIYCFHTSKMLFVLRNNGNFT